MTNTQTAAFGNAPVPAFLLKEIVRKDSRTTGDFLTIGGGRVKRVGQLAHTGKKMTRKAKAEQRADSERRAAIIARDERRLHALEAQGRGRRADNRFVMREVVVDYSRNNCVDRSLRTTVTVKCKVIKQRQH